MSMILCGSPAYLATHGRPLKVADLKHHDILSYGRSASSVPWSFREAEGRDEEVTLESRIAFDDLEAIADAATAGAGLARLPTWLIAARLQNGKLLALLEEKHRYDIYAVWPQTRHLPSKVRVAVDELVARIPTLIDSNQPHDLK